MILLILNLNQAFVVLSETSFYTQLLIPGPDSLHLFFLLIIYCFQLLDRLLQGKILGIAKRREKMQG